MEHSEQFKKFLDQGSLPHYEVIPVTSEPDVLEYDGNANVSWVVALIPALELPSENYFKIAGLQNNNVQVRNLLGIKGDHALFYQLFKGGISERDLDGHREDLVRTMGTMAAMANVWEDTVSTAEALVMRLGPAKHTRPPLFQ